ncbi:MAG: hypothetical protein A2583_16050 [Bdellovibrionales bacterium RIFOXYD1_FULL_53_11]|nr:MAG: hypothetical protein A2583_16050 [Bdellovibrionales bacterium RIFOXYD1_FULL_53_11]
MLALENRQKSVPNDFRHLFWDTDPEKLDFGKNGRYVIERVLELGSLDAFEWILKIFSLKKIIEVFVTSRNISKKSANFWMIWFGIENA